MQLQVSAIVLQIYLHISAYICKRIADICKLD